MSGASGRTPLETNGSLPPSTSAHRCSMTPRGTSPTGTTWTRCRRSFSLARTAKRSSASSGSAGPIGRPSFRNSSRQRSRPRRLSIGRSIPRCGPGAARSRSSPASPSASRRRWKAVQSGRGGSTSANRMTLRVHVDQGLTDGLPVVPPTPERVVRMLAGTKRDAQEVIGLVPPNLAPVTIEKVAINSVMAGCKPEYLPVVLAAIEAVTTEQFNMHGVLATTHFPTPVIMVNGPIRDRIGMNYRMNVLGQGNRANATIGRAVQLVVRNVGGGRPGEVDRAALGQPAVHVRFRIRRSSNWDRSTSNEGSNSRIARSPSTPAARPTGSSISFRAMRNRSPQLRDGPRDDGPPQGLRARRDRRHRPSGARRHFR